MSDSREMEWRLESAINMMNDAAELLESKPQDVSRIAACLRGNARRASAFLAGANLGVQNPTGVQ